MREVWCEEARDLWIGREGNVRSRDERSGFRRRVFPRQPAGFKDVYFGLLLALQDLFQRDVDLVEREAVRNPWFLRVLDLSEQPLYVAA